MILLIIYCIFTIGVAGIIQNIIFIFVEKEFNFKFQQRKIDNRISVKKLKQFLLNNQIDNLQLLKWLKRIIILDKFINLVFVILVLVIFGMIVSFLI